MATAGVKVEATVKDPLRLTLWVLLIVFIFNFIDRQIVNILAEPISKELGLSDTQIGLMTGIAFAAFYAILGLPIARYADRPSTNRVGLISVALVVWSGMTALCGLAQNFTQLLLARIGVGVGEAGCTPAAHSLIADMAAPEKRASAMAFYSLGIPIGSLLGLVLGGQLSDQLGWRMAFLVVGLPGIVLAVFVTLLLRDPRRDVVRAAVTVPETMPLMDAVRAVMTSRAYILLVIAASTASFLSYGKSTWTAIFFQRTHELSTGDTGLVVGLLLNGLGAITGTLLGGWLADRYGHGNRRHVLTAPAIGMLIAVPIQFAGYFATNWLVAALLLVVPYALNSLYYGPTYSSAQGLVPLRARAIASAGLLFFQSMIGLGLGPLFFGILSDVFRPMAGDESVRWVLYGAAFLGLVPAFFFWRASLLLNEELDQKV